jgi:hypothetical protein
MSMMTGWTRFARSPGDPKVIEAGKRSSLGAADRLSRGLGWLSLGLGAAALVAPQVFTRALGMRGREGTVRAFGLRELGSGVLTHSVEARAGLFSRIAGDAMDLATLLAATGRRNPKRRNALLALGVVTTVTILDIVAAQALTLRHSRSGGAPKRFTDRSGFPQGVAASRGAAVAARAGAGMKAAPIPAL